VGTRRPRAIWSGSISFGLVNAPVRMYPAIDEQDLAFHLVHEKDGSRIGYQKICKAEGESVPDEEIVKAYDLGGGDFVAITDEDFEAAESDGYRAIVILDFVPYEQIDPIYFERTYYLGPDEGAEPVYALLARALEESGLVAVGRYVFRDREQLGCLRVRDGVIVLESMYFADEIRKAQGIAPARVRVDKDQLAMARDLIDRFAGEFDPEKYEDVYRQKLLDIVETKRKGKKVRHARPEDPDVPADLMEALRQSLESAGNGRTGRRKQSRSRPKRRATRAKR
jgi:DNA end-binding protein Ku